MGDYERWARLTWAVSSSSVRQHPPDNPTAQQPPTRSPVLALPSLPAAAVHHRLNDVNRWLRADLGIRASGGLLERAAQVLAFGCKVAPIMYVQDIAVTIVRP